MSPDLPDFRDLAVAVAGDVICDRYQSCEPKSLSREAPVLVLRHIAEEIRAGGAGNVARNLRALGAKTALFGVVGRDAPGRELREALQTEQIDVDGLITAPDWITPQKTRIVAAEARRNQQQVLRIDSEPLGAAPVELRRLALSKLRERVLEFDALVLSEYDYGFVDSELAALAEEFSRRGRIIVLDPRESFEGFHGLSALTPNLGELANFAKLPSERLADPRVLEQAAAQVLERSRARWLLSHAARTAWRCSARACRAAGCACKPRATATSPMSPAPATPRRQCLRWPWRASWTPLPRCAWPTPPPASWSWRAALRSARPRHWRRRWRTHRAPPNWPGARGRDCALAGAR
jgi:rfaE bifunctional protein kinase chain/domain